VAGRIRVRNPMLSSSLAAGRLFRCHRDAVAGLGGVRWSASCDAEIAGKQSEAVRSLQKVGGGGGEIDSAPTVIDSFQRLSLSEVDLAAPSDDEAWTLAVASGREIPEVAAHPSPVRERPAEVQRVVTDDPECSRSCCAVR
jgi:hypothetical protein